MLVRPSVIILQDNKILLLKYSYTGNDVYSLPGGNPADGETLEDTLIRELKEELGVKVKVDSLALAGEVIIAGKKPTLHCVFLARITGGSPCINGDYTSALGFEWKDLNEIGSLNLYPNIGKEIAGLLAGKTSETNPYIGQIRQKWFE